MPGRRRPRRRAAAARVARTAFAERALVLAVRTGLALVLLTPLVFLSDIIMPFVVGKAIWTRSLIAVTVALWAVLAIVRPQAWGPRLGALHALLALGLAVGLAAAAFGVSPQRSLWSNYGRMQGLVDAAHWVAFAVVLTAVLRSPSDWRRYLNGFLAVGLVAALAAIVRFHFADSAAVGWWPEPRFPRISATFGNPIDLGAFMHAVALLAAGFLARSFLGTPARTPARAFWALTAVCALWALALSGSLGAFAGAAAGAGGAALLYGVVGPSPAARRAGRIALGGLALGAAALVAVLALREPAPPGAGLTQAHDTLLVERATNPAEIGAALGMRLDNWSSGLEAFAARPLTGWGPANYLVASARFDESAGATNRARDHAHSMPIEEAATKGIAGLALWLALWGWTFLVVVRAARAAAPPDQALLVFAGAALLGWLVHSLTYFHTVTVWLQHMVLLGFVAHAGLEMRAGAPVLPERARRALRTFANGRARTVAAVSASALASALAAGSLDSSHAVHAGAAALYRAEQGRSFMAELRRAIAAFGPLATFPRIVLAENVAPNWRIIRGQDEAKAFRLLAWAEAEAAHALADEPENWQLHHALAKLYAAVAETDPTYREQAAHWHRRAREVAPHQDPLMPAKFPPHMERIR